MLFLTSIILQGLLVSFASLLSNTVFVIVTMLNTISETAEYAHKNNYSFYSLTVKRAIVLECVGLFAFETISDIILINLLLKKYIFLQAMLVQICIFVAGMLFMGLCKNVYLFGIAIGLFSLILFSLFAGVVGRFGMGEKYAREM